MRIAIIGGSGTVGRHTLRAVQEAGHEAVPLSRSRGVDVTTGQGLDDALAGVDVVIDVTNMPAQDADSARKLFGGATRHLLDAEKKAGVRHHILLSIVSVERIEANVHYAGKREQERLVQAADIPYTIQRATQFHEFAEMVVGWTRKGDVAEIPPLLLQPVAAADVGQVLAEIAGGAPRGRAADLAGPYPEDMVDMARRTLAARGTSIRLIPTWRSGIFGVDAAGEALLAGPDARLAPTSFDEWLKQQRA